LSRLEGAVIDPRSPVPKYFQLREILLSLRDSELAPDAAIPSERELAERHGLTRMTVSLYSLLAERYGLLPDRGEQTIQAGTAELSDARLLGLPVGAPVLQFRRRSFAGSQRVEYVVSTYRGDRHQFRAALDVPARIRASQGGIA
jgi:DNA-binding GntR family transcriptional regulator